jgi:hypothetical protein
MTPSSIATQPKHNLQSQGHEQQTSHDSNSTQQTLHSPPQLAVVALVSPIASPGLAWPRLRTCSVLALPRLALPRLASPIAWPRLAWPRLRTCSVLGSPRLASPRLASPPVHNQSQQSRPQVAYRLVLPLGRFATISLP